ncbi:uncharacterized protein TNCV_3545321 [Trichonephila clavipes]|uniref:Uncharacterized protein n=1 Tax=Trichonephila clavipes TaxID=2585209 RepID=A0A8X6RFU5_TRICX|nr:uncharacterized protein TNCV_3545321 [Trichonephila clavipes]
MKILKYISGRGARTLRNTYIALIRPILEYGVQVYQVASASNLDKLERVQLSTVRVITGLRNSCPRDIVLYEADLQPLRLRSKYLLAKYFSKFISYGDQHITSSYVRNWHNNRRLKRESPLSSAESEGWLHKEVEYVILARCVVSGIGIFIKKVLGSVREILTTAQFLGQNSKLLRRLSNFALLRVSIQIFGYPMIAAALFSIYLSGSQSGLYRPPGVYDDFQGVHVSQKLIWGSMRYSESRFENALTMAVPQ